MTQNPDITKRAPEGLPQRTRLLIVDDDRELCQLLADYLTPMGYDVSAAHSASSGVDRALNETWDVVILDVMLPDFDGLEALRRIRARSRVPILMLTARGEEADRIVGLEVGADDYLPKTFSARELLARLRAVTRRAALATPPATKPAEDDIVAGPVRIRPTARIALLGDRPLDLTALEFDLLSHLARSRGRVKTREQLLEAIAGRDYDVFDRSIDVHICSLRKKLDDDPRHPRYIRTIRSVGYMFVDPNSDLEAP